MPSSGQARLASQLMLPTIQNLPVPYDWYLVVWKTWICLQLKTYIEVFLPFTKKIEVVLHLPNILGRLPFTNQLRMYSIYKENKVILHLQNKMRSSSNYKGNEVVLHLQRKWGLLPFARKMRLSSIYKENEVVFTVNDDSSRTDISRFELYRAQFWS